MRVGPAKPERIHPDEAPVPRSRQWGRLDGHGEVQSAEIDIRIGAVEVKGSRRRLVLKRKHGLERPGQARRRLEVADVGLYRSDRQRLPPPPLFLANVLPLCISRLDSLLGPSNAP